MPGLGADRARSDHLPSSDKEAIMTSSRIRRTGTAIAGAAVLLTATACGAVTTGNGSGDGEGFELAPYIQEAIDEDETLEIRLSYHDPSLAFAGPIREGMDEAAADYGINAEMIGPAGGDAADQVAELQTLINQQSI